MSVAEIRDLCLTAASQFEAGDSQAALRQLRAAEAMVKALPSPHHARMMWLVGMAWVNRSVLWAIEAEAEATALGDADPDHAAVGLFQLARLATQRRLVNDFERLSAALLALVAKDQGEGHPQYVEWQRRLVSLMDSSS